MNGTSDEPNFDNPNSFYKLNFKNYFMTLDLDAEDSKEMEKKPKGMTLKEIGEKIKGLKEISIDTSPLVAEYHRKITWSFSALIFVLLGFPIAVFTHRREKTANIALAIFCAAVYYLLSLSAEALSIQNITPPALTMWIPNIIALGLAIYLNYRLCVS